MYYAEVIDKSIVISTVTTSNNDDSRATTRQCFADWCGDAMKANKLDRVAILSACFGPFRVRFDAAIKQDDKLVGRFREDGRTLLFVCPEVAGGLPTPRMPSEIIDEGHIGQLIETEVNPTCDGKPGIRRVRDVTRFFTGGADVAVRMMTVIKQCNVNSDVIFVGMERSPSCGIHEVYDGTFSGAVLKQSGMVCRALRSNDLTRECRCYSAADIEDIK